MKFLRNKLFPHLLLGYKLIKEVAIVYLIVTTILTINHWKFNEEFMDWINHQYLQQYLEHNSSYSPAVDPNSLVHDTD